MDHAQAERGQGESMRIQQRVNFILLSFFCSAAVLGFSKRGEDIGEMLPIFSSLAPLGCTAAGMTALGVAAAGTATTSATISGISTSACLVGLVNYNGGNAPVIGNVYDFINAQEKNCQSDIARGFLKFCKRWFMSSENSDEWKQFKKSFKEKQTLKNAKKLESSTAHTIDGLSLDTHIVPDDHEINDNK